jgi:hypothetical protein
MPRVGFERTISVLEGEKMVHVSDSAATAIGIKRPYILDEFNVILVCVSM